jgi:hypothetical protein
VETDNIILDLSNKVDHSVPPTPLSGGGIFYVCSSAIRQPFGAAVAPFHPPFTRGNACALNLNLPQQVHNLLCRMLLPSCHPTAPLVPVCRISTGAKFAGHSSN